MQYTMASHTSKTPTRFKMSIKIILMLLGLILIISLSVFTLTELKNHHENDSTADSNVLRVLIGSTEDSRQNKTHKFLLFNVEDKEDHGKMLTNFLQSDQITPIVLEGKGERQTRDAESNETKNNNNKTNNYYEEQSPVVVHAEHLPPSLGYRQSRFGPPQYDTGYADRDDDEADTVNASQSDDNGESYYAPPEPATEQQDRYYDDAADQDEMQTEYAGEGRAAQGSAYDSYYRQWHYATPEPNSNRKLQSNGQESDIYSNYEFDYPVLPVATHAQQQQQSPQTVQQLQSQQRPVAAHNQNQPPAQQPSENTLMSTLKGLKMMWDIYQAFSAAWNVMATHRQKQDELQQQKLKQQQQQQAERFKSRINSKKPNKFDANDKQQKQPNNNNNNAGGNRPKATRTTKSAPTASRSTTTTTMKPTTPALDTSNAEEFNMPATTTATAGKVEPRRRVNAAKGDAAAHRSTVGVREKRQMSTEEAAKKDTSTEVAEGRYIKGDPLKGYYDFVITEGSYKFWAVFQTGTALLIIYSTFAAIYYSKVNPLVSDYDYTDYLGGARSMTGGDLDFVDDGVTDSDGKGQNRRRSESWFNGWLPRAGRTLKVFFDTLDKLPVDHSKAHDSESTRGQEEEGTAAKTTNVEESASYDDSGEREGTAVDDMEDIAAA